MAFLVKLLFLLVIGTFFTRINIDNISFAVMMFKKLTTTVRTVNTCFIRHSGLNGEGLSTDFAPGLSATVVVIEIFMGSSTKRTNAFKRKIRMISHGFDSFSGFKSFFEKLFKIQSLNSPFKYRSFVDCEIRIKNDTVIEKRFLLLDQPLDFFSH